MGGGGDADPAALQMDVKALAMYASFPLTVIPGACCATVALAAWGGLRTRCALLAYILWAWFIDDAPQRGGYRLLWRSGITRRLREGFFWRWAAAYCPATLRSTAALPQEKGPYIFACHPHGIFGIAVMSHFGTDATGFSRLFPGVPLHLLGHSAVFRVPFFREWCLAHGHGSVDRRTMVKLLGRGHSVALAIGGAKESLECVPGTMRLILKNRMGFVKVALQTGAALVPVMGFGENELYSTVQFEPGSWRRKLQQALQSRMGFALPVFSGLRWAPLLPKRLPVRTVVGPPVRPPPGSAGIAPSQEAIEALHAQYCEALRALFEAHKEEHGAGHMQLQIV